VTPKLLYRSAAILFVVFAALHTIGFAQINPQWGVDSLIAQLRQTTFPAGGQTRSYWDFYVGFGYSITVWQLLAGLTAWELGGLAPAVSAKLPLIRWGLVLAMVATAWLSWRYFFPAPLIFSVLITLCLTVASWRVQVISRASVG
jgi:hypothetical protein